MTRSPDLAACWPPWLDPAVRAQLETAYADPRRHYHDLHHLAEVLRHVEELLDPEDPAREAVLLAAWFHDAVYDGHGEDEECSARLAETVLAGTPVAAEVARLVRLTRTHRPAPDDHAGQVLCDADLAILAAEPDRYAAYVQGVRAEYVSLTEAEFAAGRAAVLRDLLAKPALFHTDLGRLRWEQAARARVAEELSELTSS